MTATKENNIKVAKLFISTFVEKDVIKMPLAPDAILISPLAPEIQHKGKEAVKKFMVENVFPKVTVVKYKIERIIADDESAAALYEATCAPDMIKIEFFDYLEIKDGLITKIKAYYDPRPLINMTH